jgi:hypothetical protein
MLNATAKEAVGPFTGIQHVACITNSNFAVVLLQPSLYMKIQAPLLAVTLSLPIVFMVWSLVAFFIALALYAEEFSHSSIIKSIIGAAIAILALLSAGGVYVLLGNMGYARGINKGCFERAGKCSGVRLDIWRGVVALYNCIHCETRAVFFLRLYQYTTVVRVSLRFQVYD